MKINNVTISAAARTFYFVFETEEGNYSVLLGFSESVIRFRNKIVGTAMALAKEGWELEDFVRLARYISYHSMNSCIQFFMDRRLIKDKTFYIDYLKKNFSEGVIFSYPSSSDETEFSRWIVMTEKSYINHVYYDLSLERKLLPQYRIHE